ncbi:hypothetical protein GCM10025857_33190 [Alicyclobacillus contaminans]|uniref:D-alanyl-D-alanine carboxypeptidase family protein n=1 Tax=Alicyclobacillus contaminans TaxID=392016 RepID=UPI000412E614|nr:D-alanyl-D-alanine carboxypeptidase family protein [Alicyclobacillus contaminans]GMA51962.1 hypothetical protein GCM10025857_33190 [Alicyclobacillus contaminans]
MKVGLEGAVNGPLTRPGAVLRWVLAALVVLGWVAVPLSANAAERVFVNAKAAIVLDAETGKTLYSKNADLPVYPASTTKLMTAILLVTHLQPEDLVYVSPEAARQDRVRLGVAPGTTMTAEEALYALLMKSANDVAYAVAETVGGSQEGFARMMNLQARLIGCTHTNFITPNGLHDDDHKSTAHDIAQILRAAIQYPRIVAAMQTKSYTVAGKTIRNGNRFMYLEHTTFGDVIGGKTGYTSKAMYCLAFAAKQGDHVRISVVLGAPRKSYMYRETRRLLEFADRQRQVVLV